MYDLSHFLSTCTPKRILDDLDNYLNLCYKSLSDFFKELGGDPDMLYPHSVFKEHWKKYARYGLSITLFLLRTILGEEHEAPNMSSKEEFYQTMNTDKIANQKEHDRRIIDLITMFVKMDLA